MDTTAITTVRVPDATLLKKVRNELVAAGVSADSAYDLLTLASLHRKHARKLARCSDIPWALVCSIRKKLGLGR